MTYISLINGLHLLREIKNLKALILIEIVMVMVLVERTERVCYNLDRDSDFEERKGLGLSKFS